MVGVGSTELNKLSISFTLPKADTAQVRVTLLPVCTRCCPLQVEEGAPIQADPVVKGKGISSSCCPHTPPCCLAPILQKYTVQAQKFFPGNQLAETCGADILLPSNAGDTLPVVSGSGWEKSVCCVVDFWGAPIARPLVC